MNPNGGKSDMTKIFKATAMKISIVQTAFLLTGILSIFYFPINMTNLSLILLGYVLYGGIGFSMMLHRYYSHGSFEFKYNWLKNFFDFLAIIANRGSIVGWVYTHRSHHRHADTYEDPHSPFYKKWKVFFPHLMRYNKTFNKFIVKDLLTPRHKFIDDYYFLILLINSLIMIALGLEFWLFFYVIPVSMLHIMLLCFIYFGHDRDYEYTNNNAFFGYFLFGEGWHSKHHADPGDWNFDNGNNLELISLIIRYLKA